MFVRLDKFGALGVISDTVNQALPMGTWKDARNIRFTGVEMRKMLEPTLDMPAVDTGGADVYGPRWMEFWSDGLSTYVALATGEQLYFWRDNGLDTGAWQLASRPEGYSVDGQWQSFPFGDTVIFNNQVDPPQIFNQSTLMFEDLPKWGLVSTAQDILDNAEPSKQLKISCQVLVPYKTYLVAGGITENGLYRPNTVWWSDSSSYSGYAGVPNWDRETPASLSGEVDIDPESGPIKTGAQLNENVIWYTDTSATAMTLVGGAFVMQFRRLFNKGAAGLHTVAEYNNAHFVVSTDQIYSHDGSTVGLIARDRVEEEFYKRIGKGGRYGNGTVVWKDIQVVKNPDRKEINVVYGEIPSVPAVCEMWSCSAFQDVTLETLSDLIAFWSLEYTSAELPITNPGRKKTEPDATGNNHPIEIRAAGEVNPVAYGDVFNAIDLCDPGQICETAFGGGGESIHFVNNEPELYLRFSHTLGVIVRSPDEDAVPAQVTTMYGWEVAGTPTASVLVLYFQSDTAGGDGHLQLQFYNDDGGVWIVLDTPNIIPFTLGLEQESHIMSSVTESAGKVRWRVWVDFVLAYDQETVAVIVPDPGVPDPEFGFLGSATGGAGMFGVPVHQSWLLPRAINSSEVAALKKGYARNFNDWVDPDPDCVAEEDLPDLPTSVRSALVYNFEDDNYTWMDAAAEVNGALSGVTCMRYGIDPGWQARWSDFDTYNVTWDKLEDGTDPWSQLAGRPAQWRDLYQAGNEQNFYWLTDEGIWKSDQLISKTGVKEYFVSRDRIDLDDVVPQWKSNRYKFAKQFYFLLQSPSDAVAPNTFTFRMGSANNLMDAPDWRPTSTVDLLSTVAGGQHKVDFRVTGRYLAMEMNFNLTDAMAMTGGDLDVEEAHGR